MPAQWGAASPGNPATISRDSRDLGQRLCVPPFRMVCPFQVRHVIVACPKKVYKPNSLTHRPYLTQSPRRAQRKAFKHMHILAPLSHLCEPCLCKLCGLLVTEGSGCEVIFRLCICPWRWRANPMTPGRIEMKMMARMTSEKPLGSERSRLKQNFYLFFPCGYCGQGVFHNTLLAPLVVIRQKPKIDIHRLEVCSWCGDV
jgi:hypothetical protein